MDFIGGLAVILLALVGYSIGAVIGAKDRSPTPRLVDLLVIVALWTIALFSLSSLSKWAAVGISLVASGMLSFLMSRARRNDLPSKAQKTVAADQGGSFQRRLWERWKAFAAEMGNYQGRVLLAFFYFAVVTLFGTILRLTGDPLNTKISTDETFWGNHPPVSDHLNGAKRQF